MSTIIKRVKDFFSQSDTKVSRGAQIRSLGSRSRGEVIGQFTVTTYESGKPVKTETFKRRRKWLPGIK